MSYLPSKGERVKIIKINKEDSLSKYAFMLLDETMIAEGDVHKSEVPGYIAGSFKRPHWIYFYAVKVEKIL